jgi:hypothetical protein
MKKILFPAIATLLTLASPAAFAQSGPWYVVLDDSTHSCTAEHTVGEGGAQQTVGGPFESQGAALAAIHGLGVCGM